MGQRATEIIIHRRTDKIRFFMEGTPLKLPRIFFGFKCVLYNLYLRNPQRELKVLCLPVISPHFSKSRKTMRLTTHRNRGLGRVEGP